MLPAETAIQAALPLPQRALAGPSRFWPLWTFDQLIFPMIQWGLLAGLWLALMNMNYEYVRILWTHPLGIKMLLMAVVAIGVDLVGFLLLCFLLNCLLRPKGQHETPRLVLSIVFGFVYLLVGLFPAGYVILVGPAAIQIMDNLKPPGP
jgi:hypothetical protein